MKMYSNTMDYVYGFDTSQNGVFPIKCCMPAAPTDVFAIAKRPNAHQQRIKPSTLSAFYTKARSFMLASSFSNFDSYFDYVSKNSGLSNGNCLLVYDYCLRSGYSHGLLPKENVYLFRGAREGAKAVFGNFGSDFRIPTKKLQIALGTTMESMEIEDFLCVCKKPLQYLASCTVPVCPTSCCNGCFP